LEPLSALIAATPGAVTLLGLMVAASLYGLFVAPATIDRHLLRPYWLVRRHQYLTLVTSGFLHADVAHLLFNGFTFWAFGFSLERAIGTPSFLALYFFGLFASDAGTFIKHRHDASYGSLGASGAILAVLFASILYFPTASLFIVPIPLPIPAPLFAVAYLGYTYYASRQGRGRVNHDAHLSGAIAGVVFVALTDPRTIERALRAFIG